MNDYGRKELTCTMKRGKKLEEYFATDFPSHTVRSVDALCSAHRPTSLISFIFVSIELQHFDSCRKNESLRKVSSHQILNLFFLLAVMMTLCHMICLLM